MLVMMTFLFRLQELSSYSCSECSKILWALHGFSINAAHPHVSSRNHWKNLRGCCIVWWRDPQQMLQTHRSLEAYCATLWWWRWWLRRWLVFFSFFPCNGAPVDEIDRGKTEVLGEKPVPVPLCPPQIPHGLTRDRTQASALRGRRAMARSLLHLGSWRHTWWQIYRAYRNCVFNTCWKPIPVAARSKA